jgi:DNA mismatch repair protein MutL
MPIRLLPEDVASRIAAGEVVERPASVVKELVENSLDAQASRVEVETQDGGTRLIRIRDNGAGIPAGEVALAFRRHATSKLQVAEDLEAIDTLGFRGEALSSIAAVSRLTCITRHTAETVGTRIRLEGGEVVAQTPVGRPHGTELLIEDLFYNVPARRKFLRTDRTERRHIDAFLTRYAIAYPHTAFIATHDGTTAITTPGNGDAAEGLLSVYGIGLGASLLAIPEELTAGQEIRVRGFVAPTTVHRADRGYITLFLNGRWIQDLRLTYAIIQAYHTLLPAKRYPVAFVMVEMDPADVDVNVHPSKAEVRFRDADAVFRALQRAVRATVLSEAPAAAAWIPAPPTGGERAESETTRDRLSALRPSQSHIRFAFDENRPAAPSESGHGLPEDTTTPGEGRIDAPDRFATLERGRSSQLPPLRIVGQLATMFLIAEGPDGLYLIDQHAAHERVLFERLAADAVQGRVARQPLLEPKVVALPADAAGRLTEILPALAAVGLEVEVFGPNTFLVRTLPAQVQHLAPADLLADLAGAEGELRVQSEIREAVIRHICKRAAIKAGQVLSREEMNQLIHDLERTENPRTCPHGRPTIIQISTEELARQFGRGGVAPHA